MAGEINIEFIEIPNKYKFFTDKINILERKVLFEKIKKSDENTESVFDYLYLGAEIPEIPIETIINRRLTYIQQEFEKKRVLIEKNIHLIHNKKEIKKIRNKRYEIVRMYLKNIKSNLSDTILDVTSLESVDFNRPCTIEEKIELLNRFDYYVYPEAIDEINCEIKNKDDDGIDFVRLNYCRPDKVSEDITNGFVFNQTKRLPDDYEKQVIEKIDDFFNNAIKKRVLIEKKDYPIYTTLIKRDVYMRSSKCDRKISMMEHKKITQHLIDQELKELVGNLHTGLNYIA